MDNPFDPKGFTVKLGFAPATDKDLPGVGKRGPGRPSDYKDGERIESFKVPKAWTAMMDRAIFNGIVTYKTRTEFIRAAILNHLYEVASASKDGTLHMLAHRLWEVDQWWQEYREGQAVADAMLKIRTMGRAFLGRGRRDQAIGVLRSAKRIIEGLDDKKLRLIAGHYLAGAEQWGDNAPAELEDLGSLWQLVEAGEFDQDDTEQTVEELKGLDLELHGPQVVLE